MSRKNRMFHGFAFAAVMFVSVIVLLSNQVEPASANESDPFLWPYNQPTSINFNQADVLQAWTEWRDAQITTNNAGGNGRYRVMGGVNESSTVSEGQAYGMLFASIFDEQAIFDGLYLFAKDHFNNNGVMDWHIGNPGQRLGTGGATDAEVDMALSLVNACVKVDQNSWGSSPTGIDYCLEASNLINAILTYEVDQPGSTPPAGLTNNQGGELLPGDMWNTSIEYPSGIINLSYFPPGYFTVFGKFTNNEAAWEAVNDRNYSVVDLVQAQTDNCSGLVPNWNTYAGSPQLVPWQTNNYSWWSYDAARFSWRVAVDHAWYARPEATETMNELAGFFSSTGFSNIGEHGMDGTLKGSGPYPFFMANAASAVWAAPNPLAVTCGSATGTLKESPQSAYNSVLSTKDTPNSYYGNAWRLLSMLLMTGNFPNFYELADGGVQDPPTSTPTPMPTPPSGSGSCSVDYAIVNQWGDGFQVDLTVTNNSDTAISGYELTWVHLAGQVLTSGWNANLSQVGNNVSASNAADHWNGTIAANGGSVAFGFQGTLSGNPAVVPQSFSLNGTACNGSGEIIFASSTTSGSAGGVTFLDEDIVAFDTATGTWSMFFDGSDVGLGSAANRDVDAFHILDDNSILLSIAGPSTLPNVGNIDDSDIVLFTPTKLGKKTEGTFSLYFDGSDVQLTSNSEDIDGIYLTATGDLIISTTGVATVGFTALDEDLLIFSPTSTGSNTAGSWAYYFDSSDIGLNNGAEEDVSGIWIDGSDVYLTMIGDFSISTGLSGQSSDVFLCGTASIGKKAACGSSSLHWDGDASGLVNERTDGLHIGR